MKDKIEKKDLSFSLNPNIGNNTLDSSNYNLLDTSINIFDTFEKNKNYIESLYNSKINSDFVLREFYANINSKKFSAFIAYFDGMTDVTAINDFVLKPLMLHHKSNTIENESQAYSSQSNDPVQVDQSSLSTYILNCLIPQNDVRKIEKFFDITSGINSGNCILFIDSLDCAFEIDAKSFSQRSVSEAKNEIIIKGPQIAFVESIRANTSLLRVSVNNENLIIENIAVGKLSKTKCGICYINNIANSDLVAEVKRRINNLDIDILLSSGQLEQLIDEPNYLGIPTIISTERPDKCYKYLYQGRVIILVNGNPYALIMPSTIVDYIFSLEDSNLKPLFANFLRTLRFIAILVTLLFSGLYAAATSFHQDVLPTELLFSIISSRENMSFPIIVELLIMEFSFEIIREAAIRVPNVIGSTLGIVGGLILGDAAVSANIVSNILVIIVAITGITSFSIPDFSFGFHIRIMRFLFIILGYFFGFLGIGIGLFLYVTFLCSFDSFGVPFSIPYTPIIDNSNLNFFVSYFWKKNHFENITNPKIKTVEDKISKKWAYDYKEKR